MQSINNILSDYFSKNDDLNKMKNDKLVTLINQISGDGTISSPKKIVGVSVVGGAYIGGNETDKKILETPEIMKQYLEDLKKQSENEKIEKSENSRIKNTQKTFAKVHKFYSESSEF